MFDCNHLEWPFFSKAHKDMASLLNLWAEQFTSEIGTDQADIDARCRAFVGELGSQGWLRYVVPSKFGGVSDTLDTRSLCLVREILARCDGLLDFTFAMQGLGSGAISLFGSDQQKSTYLPGVCEGRRIAGFALSEQRAGSDVAAITTSAERVGDAYVLNGSKTWISNGGIADFYTVFARTGPGCGSKGISAFIVDASTDGLVIDERIHINTPHPLATLKFDSCRVPDSALLGAPGQGIKIALTTLDVFRPTVGAAALGFSRRAFEEATKHATERKLFGQNLSDMQLTQAKVADMALDIDAAALLVYRAAWVRDVLGRRITREAAMAKLYATEAAQRVVDAAVQLFGGLGVVSGQVVEQLYREVRALRIYEGATEIQKLIIAREAFAVHKHQ